MTPLTRFYGIDRARKSLLESTDFDRAARIIDIGCGTGTRAVAIKTQYPHLEVVGIDPDSKALAKGARKARRSLANIVFSHAFSEKLPFHDGSFDRVFSSFMFHHVPNETRPQMLREAFRVLCSGGSLHLLDMSSARDKGLTETGKAHGIHRHLRPELRSTDHDDDQGCGILGH